MNLSFTQLFAFALLVILSGVASAATIEIEFLNDSWDAQGSPNNDILTVDLAAALGVSGDVIVDGIGWNIIATTVDPSWLSEITLGFGAAGVTEVILSPAADDEFAGTGAYSSGGVIDLVELDLAFIVVDGLLTIEFFESFDDSVNTIDSTLGGTLTLSFDSATPVPLPAAVWLFVSGLLALVGSRRRAGCALK